METFFASKDPVPQRCAPTSSAEASRIHWRALRILIADDDQDTVQTLAAILEDEGHKVSPVYKALEVVPAVQSFQPEAVILDIAMPKMNGYDIAKEIRLRFTDRPLLIAISGLLTKERDALFSKARGGFDHHLPKPCNPDELLYLLAPVMRQRR
jgi:DNA-binding response OmpR family regulator